VGSGDGKIYCLPMMLITISTSASEEIINGDVLEAIAPFISIGLLIVIILIIIVIDRHRSIHYKQQII
jgi:hypothetical protein